MGKGQREKAAAQQQSPVSLGLSITHVPSKNKRKSHNSSQSERSNTSINTEEREVSNLEVSQDSIASENQASFEDTQVTPLPVVRAKLQNKLKGVVFERQCRSTFNDPQKQHKFQNDELPRNQCRRNNPNYGTQSSTNKNAWSSRPSFNNTLSYSGATSSIKNEKPFEEMTKPTESEVQHETNTVPEDWEKDIDKFSEFVPRNTSIPEPTLTAVNDNLQDLSVKNSNYDAWNNTVVSETASKSDDFDDSYNSQNYDYKNYDYKNYNKKRDFKPRKSEGNWRSKSPDPNLDEDFQDFENNYNRKKSINFVRVKEITGDLFEMPKEYSLAHCVAEDMNMGSGIAVQFRREFKQVENLLDQKVRQGGVAFLEIDGRYIYYLVTKRDSSGKPTYEKFYLAVKKWRDLVLEHGVKKIAIPRLGCGLDRLEWDKVKCMVESLFQNVDVEITVCNFQQSTEENASPPKVKNCKVVNVDYPLSQIDAGTIVIFICSEDGQLNPEMHDLDKKFHFLPKFRQNKRVLGEAIIMPVQNGNYVLCGCVARKAEKDDIIFSDFKSCILQIEKWNRKQGKDAYSYVGFQAIDDRDNQMNKKLINLLRNTFKQVDVYVCWTGEMAKFMPPPRN